MNLQKICLSKFSLRNNRLTSPLSHIKNTSYYLLYSKSNSPQFLWKGKKNIDSPIPPEVDHEYECNGYKIKDEFFHMKSDVQSVSQKVGKYIDQENKFFQSSTEDIQKTKEELKYEIHKILDQEANQAPVPDQLGNYLYYSKEGNMNIFCRKLINSNKEEIMLDLEKEIGVSINSISEVKVSPNSELMAFSIISPETELCSLWIKNLKTNQILEDETLSIIEGVVCVTWSNCNNKIYYVKRNDQKRTEWVCSFDLKSKKEEIIFHEKDPELFCEVNLTKSTEYIVISTKSKTQSNIFAFENNSEYTNSKIEPFLLFEKQKNTNFHLEHHDKDFIVATDFEEPGTLKLKKIEIQKFKNKKTVDLNELKDIQFWPPIEDYTIEDIDVYKDFLVLLVWKTNKEGLKCEKFLIHHYSNQISNDPTIFENKPINTTELKFKNETQIKLFLGANLNYDSTEFRYGINSWLKTTYSMAYDMKKNETSVLSKPILDISDDFKVEDIFVEENDVSIPMTLIYPKKLQKNGRNPTVIKGYGAYGVNYERKFVTELLPLLNRGFLVAFTHTRGTSEKGIQWYKDGCNINKKNTINDYISCTKYLINNNFTSNNFTVGLGASAGGLLLGAVLNERPDLFKAMVLDFPFLDVLTTMLDKNLPLTVPDFPEYGDPTQKIHTDSILSYDPYFNLNKLFDNAQKLNTKIPAIMITGGIYDVRVQFWIPLKWAARFRKNLNQRKNLKYNQKDFLFCTLKSGHLETNYPQSFAWILQKLNIK